MLCSQCGSALPQGASFCGECGQVVAQSAGHVAPTLRADSPSFAGGPSSASGPDLTIPDMTLPSALPPSNLVPSTQLASTLPNSVPPTQRANMPATSYNGNPPAANAYMPPPAIAATPSMPSPFPPPIQAPQSTPQLAAYPVLPAPMQMSMPSSFGPQPVQSRTAPAIIATTAIVLTVVGVVLLTLFGSGVILTRQSVDSTVTALRGQTTDVANNDATNSANDATSSANNQANTQETATAAAQATQDTLSLTPTPYPPYTESHSPSGATFSGNAQHIILSAQLASQLNDQHQPTMLLSTFTPGQQFYLSYEWAQGYSGYAYVVYYFDGSEEFHSQSDYITNVYGYGDFSATFNNAGQGAIEVYYCTQADCGDKQLAWVRPFTVTGN